MANVSLWSNVQVAVQSALGTANTITAITKASPGVVSYSGTDPANGDYILLTVQGMTQVNGRVFRIANVNAGSNTLELEAENTTSYDTFSSGSFQVITFGTSLSTLTDLSASGGDFEFVDTTTIHDVARSQVPGVSAPLTYSFTSIWDVADTGLIALNAASDTKAQRAIRFTFSNGQKFVFNGYVGTTLAPIGQSQDKVETSVVMTAFGRPKVLAT
jgi:hypothetical protein